MVRIFGIILYSLIFSDYSQATEKLDRISTSNPTYYLDYDSYEFYNCIQNQSRNVIQYKWREGEAHLRKILSAAGHTNNKIIDGPRYKITLENGKHLTFHAPHNKGDNMYQACAERIVTGLEKLGISFNNFTYEKLQKKAYK